MNLFQSYRKVPYKVDDYNFVLSIDIREQIKIRDVLKNLGVSYYPYTIQDGERPDNVSQAVYDNPSFDWLILLTNNMFNIYDDWPKDQETFNRYIIEKYGSISAASSQIKYYYDAKNNIIDQTTYNNLSSSQRKLESEYEYESRSNFNKTRIKIIPSAYIGSIQSQLNALRMTPIV
jgi:hypothetical protein